MIPPTYEQRRIATDELLGTAYETSKKQTDKTVNCQTAVTVSGSALYPTADTVLGSALPILYSLLFTIPKLDCVADLCLCILLPMTFYFLLLFHVIQHSSKAMSYSYDVA